MRLKPCFIQGKWQPCQFISSFVWLIGLFVLVGTAAAQPDDVISRYYYSGTIGKKSPIQMELQVKDEMVSGHYYYNRFGKPLSLKGSRSEIEERDPKNRYTGQFNGKVAVPHKIFEGHWSKPNGRTQLPFKLNKVAEYLFSNTRQGETLEVSLSYPYFLSTSPAWREINDALLKSIKQYPLEFITEARAFHAETDQRFYWFQQVDLSIEYYSETLVSLLGKNHEYSGGAHGNFYYQSSNFWIQDNQAILLKLSDLFLPGYKTRLSNECLKSLREQGASDVVNGDITGFKEEDLSRFSITPRGLTVYFDPYAVGAYAQGSFSVTIPYRKLKNVIDPEGPLKGFVK
jgi:hypothetical protein